jgi:hypothetical protein
MVHDHSATPSDLDIRDPDFEYAMGLWANQMHSEINALVAATREVIDDSTAMMAEADRILARRG